VPRAYGRSGLRRITTRGGFPDHTMEGSLIPCAGEVILVTAS
jgi:hypothetical protein